MYRKISLIMVLGVLTLLLPIEHLVVSAEALDIGEGRNSGFAFVTADDMVSTTSSDYVSIPDMTVDVRTKGPVIVRFCAACNTDSTGSMAVTLAVDGVNVPFGMATDGGIQYAVTQYSLPRCFNWVIPGIDNGEHTFTMLWRKYGGGSAYIQGRTMIVEGK